MDATGNPTEPISRMCFDGRSGELFVIFIVNLLLSIVTLGVYRFWARTRIRQYLWRHTSFHDDGIEYTGNGKELFLGFLIALAVLVPISAIVQAIELLIETKLEEPDNALMALGVVYFAVFMFLVGFALYRARRYRLSRTVWRGIRGAQTGSAVDYARRYLGYVLLTTLTLGFFWPFMNMKLATYRLNHTWFGDRKIGFEGSGRDLFRTFAICWLLVIPTLGGSWFWYKAAEWRYVAQHTRYEDLRFKAPLKSHQLFWLVISNFLLVTLTLGLAYPYAMIRVGRYIAANLAVIGEQDFSRIAQSRDDGPKRGEGFAAALDIGEI